MSNRYGTKIVAADLPLIVVVDMELETADQDFATLFQIGAILLKKPGHRRGAAVLEQGERVLSGNWLGRGDLKIGPAQIHGALEPNQGRALLRVIE